MAREPSLYVTNFPYETYIVRGRGPDLHCSQLWTLIFRYLCLSLISLKMTRFMGRNLLRPVLPSLNAYLLFTRQFFLSLKLVVVVSCEQTEKQTVSIWVFFEKGCCIKFLKFFWNNFGCTQFSFNKKKLNELKQLNRNWYF